MLVSTVRTIALILASLVVGAAIDRRDPVVLMTLAESVVTAAAIADTVSGGSRCG